MDKVYLIEITTIDSCNLFTMEHGAYRSFRGASQQLINEGFVPFYDPLFGKSSVGFYRKLDYYYSQEARVTSVDFFDK